MIPKELFKTIKKLEIRTRGLVSNIFGGEYHSAFKGQGIEFAEVRPYQFGDDIRSIDWNVSARYEDTFVKVFEEEREQTLMLIVDVSGSGDYASQGKFKREMAAEICAVVAFSAIQNNDKVGLLLFSDQVEEFVPPKKGRRHVLRLIRDLFAHESKSRGTDLSVALNHALRVLNRRSIVLVLSDFQTTGYESALRAISRRHDTVAIQMIDPTEEALPNVGLLEITDPETGQTHVVDTGARQQRSDYADAADRARRETEALLSRVRVDRVAIHTDEGYVEPLVQFFRRRNRRRSG
jgi:uncharacterized protein (DUF58 family)